MNMVSVIVYKCVVHVIVYKCVVYKYVAYVIVYKCVVYVYSSNQDSRENLYFCYNVYLFVAFLFRTLAISCNTKCM